jgi:hypothetical protein
MTVDSSAQPGDRQSPASILIATSIAPNDRLAVQKAAIASWRAPGLAVASLNTSAEIERLAPEFPDVRFVPQVRTAKAYAGRPVIFVSDILHFLRTSGAPLCGIMNSDIFLDDAARLARYLGDAARAAFVYGARLDVENPSASQGKPDPFGFDYFFFDRSVIGVFQETHFCLGMPFWDHWLPLSAILAGTPVKKFHTPVARHVPHPTSRDDSFFMFNDEFARFAIARMSPESEFEFGRDFPTADYERLLQDATHGDGLPQDERIARLTRLAAYYDELSRYVVRFLDRNSARIRL